MRKSAVVLPLLALIAGAAGFLLRFLEVNSEFETTTGFAVRDGQTGFILIVLSAAVAVLAAAGGFLFSSRKKADNEYGRAFSPKSFVYIGASMLLGFVWLAANVLYFLSLRNNNAVTIIDLIFIFLAALSAFSVIFLARGAYKGQGGTEMLLFSVIPSIFFCFWLIVLYKNNAANPVLLSYCYQALAIAAAALSCYFSAGFVFGKAVTGRMLFSFLLTIYFCAVVLADNIGLPLKIFFAVTMVIQFMNTVVFIRNLKPREKA